MAFLAYSTDFNLVIWHNRMGHLGQQNIKRLPKLCTGINLGEKPPDAGTCLCEACVHYRFTKLPHTAPIRPGRYPMDLVSSDVMGPLQVPGYDGTRYISTFQCDQTKAAAVYLMESKGDITFALMGNKRMIKLAMSQQKRDRPRWN